MSSTSLLDRIAQFMADGDGEVDAERIAREFLRLTGAAGPSAQALVRAVLNVDPRFRETSSGKWSLAQKESVLEPPVVICMVESPAGTRDEPWLWRVTGDLVGGTAKPISHHGVESSPDLDVLVKWLRCYPVACERPSALARWIGAQERLHALPEIDALLIDLRAWQRLMAGIEGEAAPAAEPAAADLPHAHAALEKVIAFATAKGLRSWEAVAEAPSVLRDEKREAIWGSERGFTREDIAALPEEPGTYRFFARDGGLLYVGKAGNLRRRVSSYFRPLEPGSQRRRELLASLHDFSFEIAGTELEALIDEARAIRAARPPWNVQIELGAECEEFPIGERDLMFLVPRASSGYTIFALAGKRAMRCCSDLPVDRELLAARLRAFFSEEAPGELFEEIAAPERQLVRRFLGSSQGGVAVLRLTDFATFAEAADAIAAAAAEGMDASPAARTVLRGHA